MADELEGHAGTSHMNIREREALLSLCQGAERVLEIGTGDGATVSWLAEQYPGALFVSVDTFPSPDDGIEGVLGSVAEWFKNRLPNMQLFVGTALEIKELAQLDSFDLAIVDGEHTYAACADDLLVAYWLTKPSSVIAVHDYDRPSNGVKEATDEFCLSYEAKVMRIVGSMALVTREIDPVLLKRMQELGYA